MYTYVRIKYNQLTFIKTIRGMAGDNYFFQNGTPFKGMHLVSKCIFLILFEYIHEKLHLPLLDSFLRERHTPVHRVARNHEANLGSPRHLSLQTPGGCPACRPRA